MQFAPRTQRAPQTPVAESASAPVADSGLASGTLPSRETAVADSTAAFAVQGGKPRSRVREWCGAALDWLAADPYRQRSFANLVGRVGIDLVPWLGPTKKLLDARLLIKTGDGLLQHEGRVLALIGLAEMTLDTVTLGGSAFIPDEFLTGLRTARDFLRPGRCNRPGARLLPDPLSVVISPIAKLAPVKRGLDKLLTAL